MNIVDKNKMYIDTLIVCGKLEHINTRLEQIAYCKYDIRNIINILLDKDYFDDALELILKILRISKDEKEYCLCLDKVIRYNKIWNKYVSKTYKDRFIPRIIKKMGNMEYWNVNSWIESFRIIDTNKEEITFEIKGLRYTILGGLKDEMYKGYFRLCSLKHDIEIDDLGLVILKDGDMLEYKKYNMEYNSEKMKVANELKTSSYDLILLPLEGTNVKIFVDL